MPVVLYCQDEDVRSIMPLKKSVVSQTRLLSIIAKAQADVDAGLAPMYNIPFTDVATHPLGVPEKVRWLVAEKAKCIVYTKEYDQKRPNESDYGSNCHTRVEAQLKRLRDCQESLTYPDVHGTPVPRIGKCPPDAPGPGSDYVPILSNTLGDDVIFTLEDIKDLDEL